jgi:hypothetical protein
MTVSQPFLAVKLEGVLSIPATILQLSITKQRNSDSKGKKELKQPSVKHNI